MILFWLYRWNERSGSNVPHVHFQSPLGILWTKNLLTNHRPISFPINNEKQNAKDLHQVIFHKNKKIKTSRPARLRFRAAMLHRLFSAATSAAALKGKSLAVEEEEIARSKQLLYGYGWYHSTLIIDIFPKDRVIL